MDMYRDAICHELREMLTAWEACQANPQTTKETIARTRIKVINLCTILDKIEQTEKR